MKITTLCIVYIVGGTITFWPFFALLHSPILFPVCSASPVHPPLPLKYLQRLSCFTEQTGSGCLWRRDWHPGWKRLEEKQRAPPRVESAGVAILGPAVSAPAVLPPVVRVLRPARRHHPRQRPPPHRRRRLPLPVSVSCTVAAAGATCAGGGAGAGQLEAADGARVVEAEPGHDAVRVVHVLARQLPRRLPELELLLAHGALRPAVVRQVLRGDPHRRERVDGRRGGRRRARPVVLGQLLHQAVEVAPREVVPRVDGRGRGRPPRHRRRRRGGHAPARRGRRGRRMDPRRLPHRRRQLPERAPGHRGRGAVHDPPARVPVVVVRVRVRVRREVVREVARRGERWARRRVDLVEEAAVAARAEDVGGRVGDDAERPRALVAPVHAARPLPRLPPATAAVHRHHRPARLSAGKVLGS